MNEPLLSVIIPVFRVEKFLRRCLDSVINQTYKTMEIILVDDGSDDGCPMICDEYAKRDERIKVIHQKNGGLSDARNTGLKVVTGDYITFLDSDDYIDLDTYEVMLKKIIESSADIAITGYEYVDENGNKLENSERKCPIKDEQVSGKTILDESLKNYGWYYVTVWNRIYKKECWKDLYFPKGKLHEDEFVLLDLFVNANKVILIEGEKYHYVQNAKGIMNSSFSIKRLDCLEAFNDRLKRGEKILGIIWSIRMMSFIEICMKELSAKMGDSKEVRIRFNALKAEYEEIKKNLSLIKKGGYFVYAFLRNLKHR